MLLSARILTNLTSVNDFDHEPYVQFTEGDGPAIWIQLIDASRDRPEAGYKPSGRRYCPPASSTLSVTIQSNDGAKTVTRAATQPYATLDASIWKIQLVSSDTIVGTRDIALALTEPIAGPSTRVLRGVVKSVIRAESQIRGL